MVITDVKIMHYFLKIYVLLMKHVFFVIIILKQKLGNYYCKVLKTCIIITDIDIVVANEHVSTTTTACL